MSETAYILAGSNVGDREKNLAAALEQVAELPGLEVIAASAIYISEAQEMEGENPSFMNQVIMVDYEFSPHELLASLETIEKQMGRIDKGQKKPRMIDLDILIFGEQVIESERLTIPHPALLKRPFATVPLVEIVPDIIHPVTGKPIAGYIEDKHKQEVLLYKDNVARDI